MSTAILFASNYGTTEKVVQRLTTMIAQEATVINLAHQKSPDITEYETIIIAGSIRAGKIQRVVRKFCQKQLPLLCTKRIGLLLCCMETGDKAWQQFANAYPQALRDKAIAKALCGGEFRFERMNWLERKIITKISGVSTNVSTLDDQALVEFVGKLFSSKEDLCRQ